ncbi:isochorismatase family protein [Actinomadura barringtoniae]|uniref:Isochorismatase family protein n=1 Tax=Actinomadura barringtoniae TaxID=1427535 RepID=A0A939PK92_9ACTN|nr:isochorismatase family protein [Actinomadura barringtoniae]MBO2451394.1 isochorismatase family protein [Actinomadura barringtoniae]
MTALTLDAPRTALVIIDLQVRIVGMEIGPHTGADVVRRSMRLADAFRETGGLVVIVQAERPGVPEQPPGSELVEEMAPRPGDLLITKQAWNAFHETGLHDKLRGQGIGAMVLTGIATSAGVESTARVASDHGYELLLPHDAMSSFTTEMHEFAVAKIFPLLGTVCTTDEVIAATRAGD